MGTRIETKVGPFLTVENREEVKEKIRQAQEANDPFISLTQRPTHSGHEAFDVDIRIADIVTMRDTENGGK